MSKNNNNKSSKDDLTTAENNKLNYTKFTYRYFWK